MTTRTFLPRFAGFLFLCAVAVLLGFLPSSPLPAEKAEAQLNYLVPFGGELVYTDYTTCSCGFIIFTINDVSTNREHRVIWFYFLQFLSDIGLDFGIFEGLIPRVYLYCIGPKWATGSCFWGNPNTVGNYFPYEGATCWMINPELTPPCVPVEGAGDGYLIGMGTSAFDAF